MDAEMAAIKGETAEFETFDELLWADVAEEEKREEAVIVEGESKHEHSGEAAAVVTHHYSTSHEDESHALELVDESPVAAAALIGTHGHDAEHCHECQAEA